MKKIPIIIDEVVPDLDTLTLQDVLPYSKDLEKGDGDTHRYTLYEKGPEEDIYSFECRKILDILTTFYKFDISEIESPIMVSSMLPTICGLRIKMKSDFYTDVSITLDYPKYIRTPDATIACRFGLLFHTGALAIPDLKPIFDQFFLELPAICKYTPWEKSEFSHSPTIIFSGFLWAEPSQSFHISADRLDRLVSWFSETSGYTRKTVCI